MASLDQANTMSATPASSSPSLLATITSLWKEFTDAIEWLTAAWLPGLAARFVFLATLFGYYWNAALTKIDGSIFELSTGAYAQIIPPVIEAAGYDKSAVALPWTRWSTLERTLSLFCRFCLSLAFLAGWQRWV